MLCAECDTWNRQWQHGNVTAHCFGEARFGLWREWGRPAIAGAPLATLVLKCRLGQQAVLSVGLTKAWGPI